jgi:hypothetical protein
MSVTMESFTIRPIFKVQSLLSVVFLLICFPFKLGFWNLTRFVVQLLRRYQNMGTFFIKLETLSIISNLIIP